MNIYVLVPGVFESVKEIIDLTDVYFRPIVGAIEFTQDIFR